MSLFERAIDAIDDANSDDPDTIDIDGERRPKEQAHAELMTGWVRRLDPSADEAQLLAARAHHLRRWLVPRSTYPPGRRGYLRWRADARDRQASELGELLTEVGYPPEFAARVQAIVRKEGLASDPAVQTHEDACCLVFLQTQLVGVAGQLGDEHAVEVLRKTLRKMSDRGRSEALDLPMGPAERRLVELAF